MISIKPEAKELILEKIREFTLPDDDLLERRQMRDQFVSLFNPQKISSLLPEEYFLGSDKSDVCLGYELEWATRPLGSIKGGSMTKFGPKDQFQDIKALLVQLVSFSDDISIFYDDKGNLTKNAKALIEKSKKIKGMISGCTVLGKLLSIYYPKTFIPFFNDQEYLLTIIMDEYVNDKIGLESYMLNNFLLLNIKNILLSEPAFVKACNKEEFANDHFYKFLYYCFPKNKEEDTKQIDDASKNNNIEALETEHYQKLIHRNFNLLFPDYRYADDDMQNSHEGHYTTDDVGIMDFLCLDNNDNYVVIELKRKGTDQTLAQLCRYMGWVKVNLTKNNQKVLGVIVSESKDVRLEYALKVVPNISLKQMKLEVTINEF